MQDDKELTKRQKQIKLAIENLFKGFSKAEQESSEKECDIDDTTSIS